MNRLKEFVKSKQNIGYAAITLVLLLLLVSVCSLSASASFATEKRYDALQFSAFSAEGYEIVADDAGGLTYTPASSNPGIVIPLEGEGIARVTLTLAGGEEHDGRLFRLYYRDADQKFEEHKISVGNVDGNQVRFSVDQSHYTELRLDIDCTFSPISLTVEQNATLTPTRSFQVIPALLFAVFLSILLLLEKRIGYFACFKRMMCAGVARFLAEKAEKRFPAMLLHLCMWLFTGLFAGGVLLCLTLSIYGKGAMLIMTALAVLAVLFHILYRTVGDPNAHPAILFLAVCLICGVLFAYITPVTMIACYDDQTHYTRTEVMSRTLFGHDRTGADHIQEFWAYSMPDSLRDFEGVNLKLLYFDSFLMPEDGYHVNYYAYLSYLPLVFLMAVADLLGQDFLLQMTLLKLANLLIYGIVCYLGIRRLKSGGHLFSAICLCPLCMFLAFSINYDFWVTAFLLYAFCLFLSEMQRPDETLSRKTVWKMLVAMLVGCAPKAIYFLLMVPLLCMPATKFADAKQKKRYCIAVLAVMGVVVLSFILPFLINMDSQTDVRGGSDVDAVGQVKFILTDPLRYAKILLTFLLDYTSVGSASREIANFAYYGNSHSVFAGLTLMLIAFCTFADKRECDRFVNLSTFKWVTLLTCFVQTVLFSTALYVSFTPVGHETLLGVQWRYLVPVLFPALYCAGSVSLANHIQRRTMNAVVFSLSSAVMLISFGQIYLSALA